MHLRSNSRAGRDRLSLDFLDLGEQHSGEHRPACGAYRVPLASEELTKSPFRGLDVFDFDHAGPFLLAPRRRELNRPFSESSEQGISPKAKSGACDAMESTGRTGANASCCCARAIDRSARAREDCSRSAPFQRCGVAAVPATEGSMRSPAGAGCFAKMPAELAQRTAIELADVLRGARRKGQRDRSRRRRAAEWRLRQFLRCKRHSIRAHRPGDVLHYVLAEVQKIERKPIANLRVNCFGDAYPPW